MIYLMKYIKYTEISCLVSLNDTWVWSMKPLRTLLSMVRLVGNFFDDDLFLDIDYERWINILTERKPETETEKLKLYYKSVSPIWYECCYQSLPIILSTNHSHKYRHQFDNNCNQILSPKYSPPINHRNIATNLIIVATKISYQNILHQSLT